MPQIYLDHAATTPPFEEVGRAMQPWQGEKFGNASSLHQWGRESKHAIDIARETLSAAINCLFAEVIFTAGGTEAANLAILGHALAHSNGPRTRIIFNSIEHHCVLHTQPLLERFGFEVLLAPVDRSAQIDLNWLSDHLDDRVLLLSVMHANNEVGSIQPVSEAFRLARQHGITTLCDAVQTFSKLPIKADSLEADLITISAHKLNGPKGAGALYVRAGTKLTPLSVGGGQERELRAGTENVAAIVGFSKAVQCHLTKGPDPQPGAARDAFLDELPEGDFTRTLSPDVPQLDSHAHLRAPGIDAETMLIALDRVGIGASSGAACSSGSLETSHVLRAMGYSESEAREGLRFTFGHGNTIDQAREAARLLREARSQIISARA